MTKSRELAKKADVKRNLAAKYTHLANVTRSKPKKQAYLFRAERYARQAELLTRQSGA